ncbi:unnamed protein product [Dibothriocephalus latus]|uniref:Uncharacterized protein n=1 Tax=Dibothriocephalus latus TaxID=60516 RepID=A0A3P7M2P6_DIBLA|nr:unnamed protein product [Dibothriocephalus latus]
MVMGQTAEGEALHDPMRSLVEVLSPDTMTELERFRLVVIFILSRSGISEAHLDKLLDYARLSLTYKSIIAALSSVLGARLINSSVSFLFFILAVLIRVFKSLPKSSYLTEVECFAFSTI